MSITLSPNMNLPVPGVGTEAGPAYATDINNCLSLVDSHNHTPGNGVQLTPSSLNINSDLPLNNNNLTLARTVRFQTQAGTPNAATDLACLYSQGVDLYFIDGLGNNVRITQSGGVAGSPGSIANLTSPASATYVSGSSTFVWQSAANTPANMDFGGMVLRNITANSKGLTITPPNAMGADYSIVLPSLPASQKFMTLDASGNMGAPWAVDGSTIIVDSNTVQIPSNVNLPGDAAQEDGKNLVVSNTNATKSLAIVRGTVAANGDIISGEGFTVNRSSAGVYAITFSAAFGDAPSVVGMATLATSNPYWVSYSAISASAVTIATSNFTTGREDIAFSFIATGQRA